MALRSVWASPCPTTPTNSTQCLARAEVHAICWDLTFPDTEFANNDGTPGALGENNMLGGFIITTASRAVCGLLVN